ncbi:hypothetical protein [Endozoicomonas acroporae]|uniref:hypothetical protein n=1 Tax=Endozoicomonas acroporae TaxID=1701104 RepID=UPI000C791C6C|nr:hypothetical protein [Endozoicomonas acroporae]
MNGIAALSKMIDAEELINKLTELEGKPVNLRASVKTLEQRIEKLKVKKDKVDFAARLKQDWQEEKLHKNTCAISLEDALNEVIERKRRRKAIIDSGDAEAIKKLEEAEHHEMLEFLREALQKADYLEAMKDNKDQKVSGLESALRDAEQRRFLLETTRHLNKLLKEDCEDKRLEVVIARLRENRQAFMH